MKITRRQLRGSNLLGMCYPPKLVDKWEYEEGVTICQCMGRYDAENDEPLEECENCMAFESYEDWKAVEKRIKEIRGGAE